MKMYFLPKMGLFHCYVSLPEGNIFLIFVYTLKCCCIGINPYTFDEDDEQEISSNKVGFEPL